MIDGRSLMPLIEGRAGSRPPAGSGSSVPAAISAASAGEQLYISYSLEDTGRLPPLRPRCTTSRRSLPAQRPAADDAGSPNDELRVKLASKMRRLGTAPASAAATRSRPQVTTASDAGTGACAAVRGRVDPPWERGGMNRSGRGCALHRRRAARARGERSPGQRLRLVPLQPQRGADRLQGPLPRPGPGAERPRRRRFKFAATPDPANTSRQSNPASSSAASAARTSSTRAPRRRRPGRRPPAAPTSTIAVLDSGIKWNNAGAMANSASRCGSTRASCRLRTTASTTPDRQRSRCWARTAPGTPPASTTPTATASSTSRDYACDDRVDRLRHAARRARPGCSTPRT